MFFGTSPSRASSREAVLTLSDVNNKSVPARESPSASVATGSSRRLMSYPSSATPRWSSSSSPAGAASTSTPAT
ncbi:hypothetical protein PVAP13_9KG343964 [Panicum virgatum]|uniref:Uncharacterized protein n=1 Tax=Panicum virgatum TaxID=38727 RepID=A0A8T0NQ67_PANVG|nr:hypothetical protein PVAP13_9KG343964 [Panicum virgatum]